MMKKINLILILICFIGSFCFGQSYTSLITTSNENTADSVIFQHCLDSISKYVYLDSRKIKPYKAICEQMLANNSALTNRHRLGFVIECIYDQYNSGNSMGAFKIIETNKKLLDQDDVLTAQKTQLKYLEGFTLLELGESEDAQRRFYDLLAFAQANKDTTTIVQVSYSLGLLFTYQNEFENAEKYFTSCSNLIPPHKVSYRLNTNLEIVKMYIKSGQIDKAQYHNKISLHLTDSLNNPDLKLDFLLLQVDIDLEKGHPERTHEVHKEATMIAKKMGIPFYRQKCLRSYAKILIAQERFEEALLIYDELILEDEKEGTNLDTKLTYYQMAYQMAERTNNYEKGFKYILKSNEIKDSLSTEEQKQKSQYLTIKFDAEQKEQDNILLTAQVLQKQSQNKFLYALITIFLIGILFLVSAFLQKRKFNTRLKEEVKNRTKELKNANVLLKDFNEELNQFNNILSHDLKEPLRSIVGFSSLAIKEIKGIDNKRLAEYLAFVNKSGKQLDSLIDDVSTFKSIGESSSMKLQLVDMNLKIDAVIESNPIFFKSRNAKVMFKDLPQIYTSDTAVFLVFKNLIENGIKFNQSMEPTIHIDYEQKDNFHHFLVTDNGIGIAEKFHERVFGMFKRLNDRRTYLGSGLGLNIAKKLLDKVGGKICILQSEENKGSTFQISLPIVKPTVLENREERLIVTEYN